MRAPTPLGGPPIGCRRLPAMNNANFRFLAFHLLTMMHPMSTISDESLPTAKRPILRRPAVMVIMAMTITIVAQLLMILDQSKSIERLSAAIHEDLVSRESLSALITAPNPPLLP
jgi:hypothetical protein